MRPAGTRAPAWRPGLLLQAQAPRSLQRLEQTLAHTLAGPALRSLTSDSSRQTESLCPRPSSSSHTNTGLSTCFSFDCRLHQAEPCPSCCCHRSPEPGLAAAGTSSLQTECEGPLGQCSDLRASGQGFPAGTPGGLQAWGAAYPLGFCLLPD